MEQLRLSKSPRKGCTVAVMEMQSSYQLGWTGTMSYWPSRREVENTHRCRCVLAVPTELTLVLILRT